MRAVLRTADWALLRDIGALAAAAGVVAVSFGALAVAAGLPGWLVAAMSVLVFAGGSQFLAVGLLAAGSPVGALLGGLLLNARHLPYGLAIAEVVGRRWPARLAGAHLLIDESVAFAMAQEGPRARRQAYWLTGGALFLTWNCGTLLGLLLGSAVADPTTLGVDAAFPAGLLALLWPSLRDPAARHVALAAAAVALLTTPLLPAGAPVLLALAGLGVVAFRRRRGPEPQPDHAQQPDKEVPK